MRLSGVTSQAPCDTVPFMTQASEPVFNMGHKLSFAQWEPQQSGSGCDSALYAAAFSPGVPPDNPNSEDCDRCDERVRVLCPQRDQVGQHDGHSPLKAHADGVTASRAPGCAPA